LTLAVSMLLAGCMGYVPGRQTYWDGKVKEMCEKDGGVRLFQKVHLSKSDVEVLGRVDGKIGIPIKELAHEKALVYAVHTVTIVRAEVPYIWRTESSITRRRDQVVVARWVAYTRSGGDFPSPAHESRFTCPDQRTITSDIQQLFIVQED
jgi:hypothetical protein